MKLWICRRCSKIPLDSMTWTLSRFLRRAETFCLTLNTPFWNNHLPPLFPPNSPDQGLLHSKCLKNWSQPDTGWLFPYLSPVNLVSHNREEPNDEACRYDSSKLSGNLFETLNHRNANGSRAIEEFCSFKSLVWIRLMVSPPELTFHPLCPKLPVSLATRCKVISSKSPSFKSIHSKSPSFKSIHSKSPSYKSIHSK
jgi:hypothetical protein